MSLASSFKRTLTLGAIAALLCAAQPLVASESDAEPQDKYAPKINAKLLFATTYGGPGDQWFAGVRIRNAANRDGLSLGHRQ